MLVDHVGHYFFPASLWFLAIGRIGFPVWFFLFGYNVTRPIFFPDYFFKLGIKLYAVGFLIQLAFYINLDGYQPLNALYSFVLGGAIAAKMSKTKNASILCLTIIIIASCHPILRLAFDYGSSAVFFILAGIYHREQNKRSIFIIVFSYAFFIFWQLYPMPYDVFQSAFIIFFTGLVCASLFVNYKALVHGFWDAYLVRLLSRRTLEIYFIHLVLFTGILCLLR